jgi:hypothetical protein
MTPTALHTRKPFEVAAEMSPIAGTREAVLLTRCRVGLGLRVDGLGDRARNDYLFARTVIGRDFLAPEVMCRRAD